MAQSWSPNQASLDQLIQLLRESQTNPQHQSGVSEKLDQFATLVDYSNYLVYILTQVSTQDVPTRSIAGLLLKNHIRVQFQKTPMNEQWDTLRASLAYVQAAIMPALSFEEAMLRRTATQVVAMIMSIVGPEHWPTGMETLTMLIGSQNPNEAEGAFSTFAKLCEDIPYELEKAEIGGTHIMNVLVPKFLQATEHPSEQIRVHALNCLNQFIQHGSNALINHIDAFIQALFKRASDEKAMVRRFVCQALVYILGWRPDKLLPEMNNVVEYMLYSTQDQDEEVALEACEFWLQFAEDPSLAESLRPYVNKIAPVLLKGMVYSEIDVLMLDGDDDDAAVPDKPEDIKPRFGAPKLHKNERTEENGDSNNVAGGGKSRAAIDAEANKGGDEDEDDYDDDSDYDEDEDALAEWNLRKCSAAALDVMAITFPDELLNVLLPLLKEKLFSSDWLQRESGILALGAIAEGCISGVQPHLPTLVPFLINCLSDSKPLVRSISCWTLGRYSSWCVSDKSSEHQTAYFVPTMEGLLLMALDNNKRVQEAGCSAFATLEEEAGASLAPFLEPVLKNLVFAFEQYQQKNLLILYDAIGTLADSVGSELNRPDYVSLLMPPLIAKWQTLSDDDQGLIPLLECLSSVTIAVGEAFLPYSPPVFQRCVAIVGNTLSQIQKEASLPEYEREAERTFVIVALDLLSGLTQGLAANVKELVQMSQPPLIPLLKICITDSDAPVRQSAYALLGDLAISAFPLLRPNLEEIMPELIQQIEPEPRIDNISVCNNAAWCAGEIALQYGAVGAAETELQKWVDPLIQRLVPVLLNPKTVKSLSENAAVTIGRLGLVAPVPVAPHLNVFIESWCEALWDIKDNEEKDSAFRGMCEMIQLNPNGATKGFVYFCNAVVRWSTPSARLNEQFTKILTGFRDMSGDQWEVQKQQFPPVIVQRLAERYGL